MKKSTDKNILIPSFDGGMHLQTNPLLIKANEATIAKNVDLDEIGTLKKTKGYSAFGNIPSTDPIISLFAFYEIGTTTTRFLLRDSGGVATSWIASTAYALNDVTEPTTSNGYLYKCTTAGTSGTTEPTWITTVGSTITDGTVVWTCIKRGMVYTYDTATSSWVKIDGSAGLDPDINSDWFVYQNKAIRFNGLDNPKKFDGTTFADLGGTPPNGSVATLYKDRVYISGVSPNYSTLYFSEVGDPEKYPASNNADVNNNDGDKIRALVPLFDSLIVFKEYSIWEWQVDSKNNPAFIRYITKDVGTTSQKSVQNINGIVYFFNRKGIWMLAQKYPELISLKMDKFIRAVSNPYNVVAFTDRNKYCLYIGDVVVDEKAYSNTLIIFDTLYNQWQIKCLANPLTTITPYIKSDDTQVLYFGSDNGQAYLWNDGYSFNGIPIEMEYETKMFQPGDPQNRKIFVKTLIRLDEKPASSPEISYSIDHRNWVSIGLAESVYSEMPIVDLKKTGQEEGKDIRLRIYEVSDQQMKPVYQIVIYYLDRDTSLTI